MKTPNEYQELDLCVVPYGTFYIGNIELPTEPSSCSYVCIET